MADGSGNCIGGDGMLEAGFGGIGIGYISNSGGAGTVPVYRSTCYGSGGSCTGWGLSLQTNGTAVGYLATTAPDSQSAAAPFIQSNGLLLQGLSGTASAYLWSATPHVVNHTTHLYLSPGPAPDGYTSEGITGYIDQSSSTGTAPLYRYRNSDTGYYYYSMTSDAPTGFSSNGTLGYLHTAGGSGLTALYRHNNSTTGDYLLTTSASPPSGYQLQATLGYIHTNSSSPSSVYQDLTYQYDNGGNITFVGDALWSGGREFAYDDLNRLTQASGNFGPNLAEVTHNYTYDPIGNVLSKAGVLYYYCGHPLQPASSQYCSGTQHPSAVVNTSDGNVYTYDYNGSTYTGAGRTYTWNAENRLAELSAPGGTVISTYDSTGTRIKKQASGAVTYFPFAGYEVTGGVFTKYIRIGIEIVAAKIGGEKRFYHNDHQGGVNIITDFFAGIVQVNEYDPWGKVTRSEGNVEPTKRFNGKELDEESGLYYYGGRYYDPNLMRFVSPDPFIQEPGNPQNFNRYSYTINNPQKYVDPSGHFFGLIFSLIFNQATASKLWAASDPFGFLLSKIPKKVNGGINIFGGIAMLISGNPMGAFYIASGAMSFGKGNGFQIASQVLGIAGTIGDLYYSYSSPASTAESSGELAEGREREASAATGPSAPTVAGPSSNPDRVAMEALQKVNPDSVQLNTEYAGLLYEKGGKFYATPAVAGEACQGAETCGSSPWGAAKLVPKDAKIVFDYHTHGAGSGFEQFSRGDVLNINGDALKRPGYTGGYLGTPKGEVYFYKAGTLTGENVTLPRIVDTQRHVGTLRP